MMCASGVSGVGVLDGVGVLIANLSISDVRCIQPEHFGVLGLPVAEFLALLHGTSYAGFSGAYVRLSQIQAHCFISQLVTVVHTSRYTRLTLSC